MKIIRQISLHILAFAFLLMFIMPAKVSATEYTDAACSHNWVETEVYTQATINNSGSAKFTCSLCSATQTRTIPRIASVVPTNTHLNYTGSPVKSKVIVTDTTGAVIPSTYYKLTYYDNIEVGTASIKVSFKGLYGGKKTTTFRIIPLKPTITTATGGELSYTLKWTTVAGVDGYELFASTTKDFGTYFKKTIKSGTTAKATVTLETGGITYYVRMRSYCTVNDKKYYSKWSATKTVDVAKKHVMTPQEEVVALVNEERAKVGLAPVVLDKRIEAASYIRAQELTQKFDHTRPNGKSCFTVLTENNISYMTAGENIAAGYSSAKSVVTGWMNSSGHKANILNPKFRKLGVGYYKKSGTTYTYYWVQLFTD